jgi:hypothetical protein
VAVDWDAIIDADDDAPADPEASPPEREQALDTLTPDETRPEAADERPDRPT